MKEALRKSAAPDEDEDKNARQEPHAPEEEKLL